MDICCGLYRGSLFLQEKNKEGAALLPVGNAEFTITQELTEITQENFQSLGGNQCAVSFINSMNLEMVLHCLSPENLAKAFMGSSTVLEGAAVEDEEHLVNAVGELIALEHTPDKSIALVVKNEAEDETYVEGEDYKVTNAGIIILDGDIVLGENVKVSYTYGNNLKLDALTTSQKEFYVVFDGVNVGDGGETPVVIKFYKVKLSPTDSFAVITTEFASLNLTGEVLRDESVAVGSKFFTAEWGVPSTGGY